MNYLHGPQGGDLHLCAPLQHQKASNLELFERQERHLKKTDPNKLLVSLSACFK